MHINGSNVNLNVDTFEDKDNKKENATDKEEE
jgi:hypothetical protein